MNSNSKFGSRSSGRDVSIWRISLNDFSADDLWIHDETDRTKANLLVRFFDDATIEGQFPRPFGVFYSEQRFTYEAAFNQQIADAIASKGAGDLDKLLRGPSVWEVK